MLAYGQYMLLLLLFGLSAYRVVTSILIIAKAGCCIRNARVYLIVSPAVWIPVALSFDYPAYPFYVYLGITLFFGAYSAGWYLYLSRSKRVSILVEALVERRASSRLLKYRVPESGPISSRCLRCLSVERFG